MKITHKRIFVSISALFTVAIAVTGCASPDGQNASPSSSVYPIESLGSFVPSERELDEANSKVDFVQVRDLVGKSFAEVQESVVKRLEGSSDNFIESTPLVTPVPASPAPVSLEEPAALIVTAAIAKPGSPRGKLYLGLANRESLKTANPKMYQDVAGGSDGYSPLLAQAFKLQGSDRLLAIALPKKG